MSAPLVVVTGACGGLGRTIVARFCDRGHRLLLVDRDASVGEAAGGDVHACVADLATDDGLAAVVGAVRGLGGAAVLVNNAGITRDGRVGDLTPEAFALVVDVNLVAAMRLTLALEGALLDGAAVVNVSSRAGLGNFGQANYVTAKAGLMGFTRALALQWAPRVRVNAIAPGLVDTPMTRQMPEKVLTKLVDRIPAGRIGTPDDVADAIAFLAGPSSAYVTGQLLIACGGRSLAP